MHFSDLVAFVDREARILTNPVFGKISDTIRSAPGQRSSGSKTSNFKNLSLLAQVEGSEGPPVRQLRKVQRSQVSEPIESRELRLARIRHPEPIPLPRTEKFGVSIVAETTPLRIVSHYGGNPTQKGFNSWYLTNCASDAYLMNISQGFARRGKLVKLRTAKESILLFYTQALVRKQQWMLVLAQRTTLALRLVVTW